MKMRITEIEGKFFVEGRIFFFWSNLSGNGYDTLEKAKELLFSIQDIRNQRKQRRLKPKTVVFPSH